MVFVFYLFWVCYPVVMKSESQYIDVPLDNDALKITVSRDGYWFGNEVVALVDFLKDRKWQRCVDLGCGDGVIALLVAKRNLAEEVWAIDIDSDHCQRTEMNVKSNQLAGKVSVINKNLRSLQGVLKKGTFDLLTANPPFFKLKQDHQDLSLAERKGRQEVSGDLKVFLQAAEYLGKKRSDLYLVYHPSRLDYLFTELNKTSFKCKHIQALHHQDGRALFVLCHCIKSGGPGVTMLPPVTMGKSLKHQRRSS